MGLRFRRSVKIAKGVRLNVGKTGVSISTGTRGFRHTVHSSGRETTSVGIPGTGLSYVTTTSRKKTYDRVRQEDMHLSNINTVNDYDYYVNLLKTLHKEGLDSIDWESIAKEEEPFKKGGVGPLQMEAVKKYENYKPGLFEKILPSLLEKKKEQLKQEISRAEEEDKRAYDEWECRNKFAKCIMDADEKACETLLSQLKPFSNLYAFCEVVKWDLKTNGIVIDVKIKTDIVPSYSLSLTKTNKVSKKDLTKTAYYDLMNDFVSSICFRIARDMFSVFHTDTVIVNALDRILNTSTGHEEDITILSIKFNRGVFTMLNLDRIDPSDAVKNFKHSVEFVKTRGFKPVKKLIL